MQIIDIAFHGVRELQADRLRLSRNATGTLIVPADADARAVATWAEQENAGLILVTDPDDVVRGVIAPAWTIRQVRRFRNEEARTLVEAVETLAAEPDAVFRGYGHEWLGHDRPQLYWCEAGHYTDKCPCSAGHSAPCGPSDD